MDDAAHGYNFTICSRIMWHYPFSNETVKSQFSNMYDSELLLVFALHNHKVIQSAIKW